MYVERQKTKQINIETKLEISLIIIDQSWWLSWSHSWCQYEYLYDQCYYGVMIRNAGPWAQGSMNWYVLDGQRVVSCLCFLLFASSSTCTWASSLAFWRPVCTGISHLLVEPWSHWYMIFVNVAWIHNLWVLQPKLHNFHVLQYDGAGGYNSTTD